MRNLYIWFPFYFSLSNSFAKYISKNLRNQEHDQQPFDLRHPSFQKELENPDWKVYLQGI